MKLFYQSFILLFLFISCSTKQMSSGDSNVYSFSSSGPESICSYLEKSDKHLALDLNTGILYFENKNRWRSLNPIVDNFEEISNIIAEEGQIIQTRGFYIPGDGGEAKFKVIKNKNAIEDNLNVFKLCNKLSAVRVFEGRINVRSFGAKGNADITGKGFDNTLAFQQAIDFVYENGGGELYIPSSKRHYYKVSNIYIKNGINLTGDVTSVSQEHKDLIGTKIIVSNNGQGIIVGDKEYFPTKRVNGVLIQNLIIQGLKNSISGIRIGSDKSFITPGNVIITNCIVEGFRSDNVNQIVYDKTTKAFGRDDGNFPGTHKVKGACGIFLAGGISVSLINVRSQKNFVGLYESAGGFCTALNISGGSYRENIKNGLVFTTAKSASLNNLVVVETNGEEGIKLISPKTTIEGLKSGPCNIYIENLHLEHNNHLRTKGYSILIENENKDHFIQNITISNSRLDFYKHHGIYILRGRDINIQSNGVLMIPDHTQIYSNLCENIEYDGPVIGKMSLDKETRLLRKGKNTLKRFSGNIVADYRAKKSTDKSEYSLIVQGDIAILPDYILSEKDAFKLCAWGRFESNVSKKSLNFKLNNELILSNINLTNTASRTWFAEIIISVGQNNYPNQAKSFGRLQIGNEFEAPQIFSFQDKNLWKKINRLYITTNEKNIVLEGYQLSYESF